MMEGEMLSIVVPGSTANLGPGFDSIGLAIDRYLTLDVTKSEEWVFVPKSEDLLDIPTGKGNLVFQVAESVAKDYDRTLPACKVEMFSDIPMSRGLGSSASAIVAGIELANQLLDLNMTLQERLRRSSLWEGHLDNVAASLFGGLVIGSHREDGTDMVEAGTLEVDIIVLIPSYELKTEKARSVLPEKLDYKIAVEASGISNLLVAALLQKNWTLAGKMMKRDLFHQPHRSKLVPEYEPFMSLTEEYGAFGGALSGAGPTMICFAPEGKGVDIQMQLRDHFPHDRIELLRVDSEGIKVFNKTKSEQEQPF